MVDPYGATVARLDESRPGFLVADVKLLQNATFYTRFGDARTWLLVVVACSAVALGRGSRRFGRS